MALYSDPSFIMSVFAASLIFLFLAAGVMLVLWIAMPFSLFGLKATLKKLTEAQQETNRLLQSLLNQATGSEERQRRADSALGIGAHLPKNPKEPLQ